MNHFTELAPEAIVYGTVCLDRFLSVDTQGKPLPGAPGLARDLPGGEAFNTATALAGWDVRVLLTGTAIGADAEGELLRILLDTHPLGLPRAQVPDDPGAVTPLCTIHVFPDGERKMNGRGFGQAVGPPPLPPKLLASRPLWVCDPNLGQPAIDAALSAAEAGCTLVAMDFAPVAEVVARSRILVTSVEMLSRQRIAGTPVENVQRLRAAGARTAVITRGSSGCVVADADEGVFEIPAFQVEGVVDTTGAGDIFRAGLCYGLLRGLPLREILRFAAAAAAVHCRVYGGGSRPLLDEVHTLLASAY